MDDEYEEEGYDDYDDEEEWRERRKTRMQRRVEKNASYARNVAANRARARLMKNYEAEFTVYLAQEMYEFGWVPTGQTNARGTMQWKRLDEPEKVPEPPAETHQHFVAVNIVNQLFDLANVPVEMRQEINDRATNFVEGVITR